MSLTVANTGGDFKPAPAGSHLARCYRIIDLGTQKVVWKGTEKAMKKIIIGWELHGDDAEGNPLLTEDGRPLVVSRKFTPSLADKAALRAFLVAWRGKQFTNDELMGFSLKNIIGAWCMINISHEDRDGKTYANISAILPAPKGQQIVAKTVPTTFTVAQLESVEDLKVAELPEWLEKKVVASEEYKKLVAAGSQDQQTPDDWA